MTTTTRVRYVLVALVALGLSGSALHGQAPKEPETIVLPGGALGAVTLSHQAHVKTHGARCETCHHPSKAEKPLKTAHQKCGACHTKAAVPPMVTKLQAAFHDPMARKGTCVDCHRDAAAKGKKAPVKCADCHRKG